MDSRTDDILEDVLGSVSTVVTNTGVDEMSPLLLPPPASVLTTTTVAQNIINDEKLSSSGVELVTGTTTVNVVSNSNSVTNPGTAVISRFFENTDMAVRGGNLNQGDLQMLSSVTSSLTTGSTLFCSTQQQQGNVEITSLCNSSTNSNLIPAQSSVVPVSSAINISTDDDPSITGGSNDPPAELSNNTNDIAAAAPKTISSSSVTTVMTQPPVVTVKTEPGLDGLDLDKNTIAKVLAFLKKNNLKETEAVLQKELQNSGENSTTTATTDEHGIQQRQLAAMKTKTISGGDISTILTTAYASEGDPLLYEERYRLFLNFVENSLDMYKAELSIVLYPMFVHMYLELIYNGHESAAKSFYKGFVASQEQYHREDLHKLSTVTKREHMMDNELMVTFRNCKFVIRMSRDSYQLLKKQLQSHTFLQKLIQDNLYIDVYDGIPRTKQQIDATAGGLMGEATKDANKTKVYYGLLKEPELTLPPEDDEEASENDDKPKKKKPKKDPLANKKNKPDPNAPPTTRIPLPTLRDIDRQEKVNVYKESLKRTKLSPEHLPTICFYTIMNSPSSASCISICDDSSLISVGFSNSNIRLQTLTPKKMKHMRSGAELLEIDIENDDVFERIMSDRSNTEFRNLLGHNGPVYQTDFSPDRNLLLSASEDGSLRLWSLHTFTNIVVYKGHQYSVWDCSFSPFGYYFISASQDKTVRLWATEHYQPLRIFTGHLSDVDCVRFHPNSNYIASGSSDRCIRVWDILDGKCVRTFTGHKGAVYSLQFSPDGRYLASGGADGKVLMWDIAHGALVADLKGHSGVVNSLTFDRDGVILTSGAMDNSIRVWDVKKLFSEMDTDELYKIPPSISDSVSYNIGTYFTKHTPVQTLHFTRRNLLLAAGSFAPPKIPFR